MLRQELREMALRLPPGSPIPSVRELIKQYSVSQVTVVGALETLKKEGLIVSFVGDGTYTKGKTAIQESKTGQTVIELLIHNYPSRFSSMIKDAVANACQWSGISLKINMYDHLRRMDEIRISGSSDAIIFSPGIFPITIKELSKLESFGVPLVCLGVSLDDVSVDSISTDDRHGGALAAAHLAGLGHRKISVVVAEPEIKSPIRNRIDGFIAHSTLAGITPDVINCGTLLGENPFDKAYETIAGLAKSGRLDCTALFVDTDNCALGAIRALSDAGLNVPNDISVIGFDGIPEGAYYRPALTTISQDLDAWAQAVISTIHLRTGNPSGACSHLKIKPRLTVRESTAKVK